MLKRFNRENILDKKFSSLIKEAEGEDGIILGYFQIVRFEEGKWYAIEDVNGERRIVQCQYKGMFTLKDTGLPGNINIAKVFWEYTEEELFAETFSPYPTDRT